MSVPAPLGPARIDRVRSAVRALMRGEDGAMTIFGLMIFLMMLLAGGIALDLMRSEVDRTELQYTIDRATLAATSLERTEDARDVLRGYLEAAGLPPDAADIRVDDSVPRQKTVRVTARSEVDSLFVRLLGEEVLTQPVSSVATQSETDLEVSLVLDLSGSMQDNLTLRAGTPTAVTEPKITTLRREAQAFVRQILQDNEDRTFVTIVPYTGRVNLGSVAGAALPLTDQHTLNRCVNFTDDQFAYTGLPLANAGTFAQAYYLHRLVHHDEEGRSNNAGHHHVRWNGSDPATSRITSPSCFMDDRNAVIPWSSDLAELEAAIAGFSAGGSTSTALGVRLGAAMLDPTTRAALQGLTETWRPAVPGQPARRYVDPRFAGRPAAYADGSVRKVLIVMTDGKSTRQWGIAPDDPRARGAANVFVHRVDTDGNAIRPAGLDADRLFHAGRNADGPTGAWIDGPADTTGLMPVYDTGDTCFGVNTFVSFWDPDAGQYITMIRDADESCTEFANQRYVTATEPSGGADAVELTWPELHAMYPLKTIRYDLLNGHWNPVDPLADWYALADVVAPSAPWLGTPERKNWWGWQRDQLEVVFRRLAELDAHLSEICSAVRQKDVMVFAITFDPDGASDHAADAMRDCAGIGIPEGTPGLGRRGQYYEADGQVSLKTVFSQIVASIENLRLVE
jgi:Flp pilus assembly protein TadG